MSFELPEQDAIVNARTNIALIQQWTAGFTHATLSTDLMRRYAVERAFIAIGEALKDVPREKLQRFGPTMPWRKIIGFRDWLAHSYDETPDERMMDAITLELPKLDAVLLEISNASA